MLPRLTVGDKEGDTRKPAWKARKTELHENDNLTVHADKHVAVDGKLLGKAGQEIHLAGGVKIVMEAGAELTLKAGGSWLTIGPNGITADGPNIFLNCGGSPSKGSGAEPELPIAPDLADYYTEHFILKTNGRPFANAPYHIILEDDSSIGGVTDKDGKTTLVIDKHKKPVAIVFDDGFPVEYDKVLKVWDTPAAQKQIIRAFQLSTC